MMLQWDEIATCPFCCVQRKPVQLELQNITTLFLGRHTSAFLHTDKFVLYREEECIDDKCMSLLTDNNNNQMNLELLDHSLRDHIVSSIAGLCGLRRLNSSAWAVAGLDNVDMEPTEVSVRTTITRCCNHSQNVCCSTSATSVTK